MKLSTLFLSCLAFFAASSVNAGSYSVRSYSEDVYPAVQADAGIDRIETLAMEVGNPRLISKGGNKEERIEPSNGNSKDSLGWITGLGKINDQYHKDIQALTARKKAGTSYARISSPDNLEGLIISGRLAAPEITASAAIARQSSSIYRNAYDAMINALANKHGVPIGLVKAVMHTESSFNQNARSHAGAQGLMQLMPATARRFSVTNAYDPYQNIEGGVRYLSWLIKRYNGDLRLALAGYNAGEGNVDKYKGIPPFKETQQYVVRVMDRYNSLYTGY